MLLFGKGVRFYLTFEWGGGEAGRLPWEKEVGEIPQGDSPRKLASSPTGKRVASQPPLTLNTVANPNYIGINSSIILPFIEETFLSNNSC
ncbi:hypothetical protein SAMN04487936_10874 [Halobacillus dabanensis]|uniref:Uncharacterized protein n=1 Tax=Halobacillus dabanensis TaxID=240302 RepID=A0A1I3X907_HALDA|nr:hypothetical protein SAMN04487936_10874 [Halobacillus dabanensis]